MDFDIKSVSKVVPLIVPEVLAADNTPDAIDLAGWRGGLIQIHVGIGGITFSGTNKVEFVLTHSEDDVTYDAVEADDVIMPYGETLGAGGIIRALTEAKAAADAEVYSVGYIGKRQYIKLLADFSGTHGSGTPMAASLLLQHGHFTPPHQASIEV
jgi:hypothetical protein